MIFILQVRAIGMNSPELLRLVEHCPTGAETLVTRVLHIVTDKSKSCVTTIGQLILAKKLILHVLDLRDI